MSIRKHIITAMLLLCIIVSGCKTTTLPEEPTPDAGLPSVTETQPPSQPELTTPPELIDTDGGYEHGEDGPGGNRRPRGELRAVWVATVLNLDFPSARGLSANAMKREIDMIVNRTAGLGLNAIILQVRPTGDAFYQSDIFPWSQWLSGTQGVGITGFDPLRYWIEKCHDNGIELHAWLNPYRIIHTTTNSSDPGTLAPGHPVRLRPELAVAWKTSNGSAGLFLDPGLPDARELIIDSIVEIIERYDVDGIHIDDYFYPGANFNDEASYASYGGGLELADWRRENVNELVRGIQSVIREHNEANGKDVLWGVSPSAIWKNGSSDPLGVPTTNGQESYSALFADTRRWVMEEWIDYICPQIYWYIGFETANFEPVLNWWTELCEDYNVELYIGHAAYREVQDDQSPRWRGEILRQLEMAAGFDVIGGSFFYRFESLRGSVGNTVRDYYIARDGLPPVEPLIVLDTLTIGMPREDVTLAATASTAPGYMIAGTSDPRTPLYLNGEEVTSRTIEGFFSVYVTLETGGNSFTFSQEGQENITRSITRNPPEPPTTTPGQTPTVSDVTRPRYATVTSDAAWVFPGNTASGGSDWMMAPGQRDRVVAESSNGYVKLSCGMWINLDHVELSNERRPVEDVFKNGEYRAGTDVDILAWKSDVYAGVYASLDGHTLTVSFGMHTEAPPLTVPDDLTGMIITDVSSGIKSNTPYYAFTLRDDLGLEGYYTDFEDGEFRLYLKLRKTLAEGDKPLEGITIVLDPGHGGDEFGAIGFMGTELAEKHINLINAIGLSERLTELGATVHLTRDADVTVTLQQRVDMSRQVKPDLFISLHVNSVAETTNAANIRGLSVWYRNPGSVSLAQTMLDTLYYINPATNRSRGINQANFFVCRPAWAPSVILEASFIVNMDDFVWLIDPAKQDELADAMADAILEYFAYRY